MSNHNMLQMRCQLSLSPCQFVMSHIYGRNDPDEFECFSKMSCLTYMYIYDILIYHLYIYLPKQNIECWKLDKYWYVFTVV